MKYFTFNVAMEDTCPCSDCNEPIYIEAETKEDLQKQVQEKIKDKGYMIVSVQEGFEFTGDKEKIDPDD